MLSRLVYVPTLFKPEQMSRIYLPNLQRSSKVVSNIIAFYFMYLLSIDIIIFGYLFKIQYILVIVSPPSPPPTRFTHFLFFIRKQMSS